MRLREGLWWSVLIAGIVAIAGYALSQLGTRNGGVRLPTSTFLERSGRVVSTRDFDGRVHIIGFFFSCCQASCPKICQAMQELQRQLRDTEVQLVLISVDPETDRPARLREVAASLRADPERWWFLTQVEPNSDQLFAWIEEGFGPAARPKQLSWYYAPQRGWDVAHSNRLFLLDRQGHIRDSELVVRLEGDGTPVFVVDEEAVNRLAEKARRLAGSPWFPVRWLPTLNVALNAISLVLLVCGFTAIRFRQVTWHRRCMLAAAAVSALFLASYVYYHWHVGHTRYPGEGWDRTVYLAILASHVILAAVLVLLVPSVLLLALRQRWATHRRLARCTLPIWLYVCLTGIVVYVLLYGLR
ncbi:SCO1 protein [bacterium HR36]|nr:SCO1 protein [bacterium HR36]